MAHVSSAQRLAELNHGVGSFHGNGLVFPDGRRTAGQEEAHLSVRNTDSNVFVIRRSIADAMLRSRELSVNRWRHVSAVYRCLMFTDMSRTCRGRL